MIPRYWPTSSESHRRLIGPIVRLHVRDNQLVKQGDLLFEIDDSPYRYALQRTLSEQAALEGQISDERRRIAALVSAVSVSQASIRGTEADVTRSGAAVDQARAEVANAEQGVTRAQAEWAYATNNLHRIEPLLEKQFVTADQRTHSTTTSRSKCRPLNSSSTATNCGIRPSSRTAAAFAPEPVTAFSVCSCWALLCSNIAFDRSACANVD